METRDLIILVAVVTFVAVRLYQKYGKKGIKGNTGDNNSSSDIERFSGSKDDDYEPYSKKKY